MDKQKKYTRRYFIKTLSAISSFAFIGLWYKMMQTKSSIDKTAVKKIKFDPKLKVNFLQDYILVKSKGEYRLMSSRCTHLGCRISEIKNDNFICPCHGSSYNKDGKVIKGPSIRNLQLVDFELDELNNIITIKS